MGVLLRGEASSPMRCVVGGRRFARRDVCQISPEMSGLSCPTLASHGGRQCFWGRGRSIVAGVWGFIRLLRGGSVGGAGAHSTLQSLVRSPVSIFCMTPMRAIAHRLIGDLLSEVTLPQRHAWLAHSRMRPFPCSP